MSGFNHYLKATLTPGRNRVLKKKGISIALIIHSLDGFINEPFRLNGVLQLTDSKTVALVRLRLTLLFNDKLACLTERWGGQPIEVGTASD